MKDRFGRIKNRHQAIEEFNIGDLAYLFYRITVYPEQYPKTFNKWVAWLKEESGEDVIHL